MRHFAALLCAATFPLAVISVEAQTAKDYPAGPVKMIIPFNAGGPTDVVARMLIDPLSARWGGKPIVLENRPGAGTQIGSNAIAKAQADGHTVGMIVNSFITNAAILTNQPFDPIKDFTPIAMVAVQPMALVATKSFPPNSVAEMIAYIKQHPGAINYTSPAPRGTAHLAGEMLKQRAGIDMTHINYTGSAPALTDLVAGRVQLMFDVWHSAKRYVDTGDLKLIAPIGAERLKDRPDVPTLAEAYPGFDITAMQSVVGPAGIPHAVADKIAADIVAVVFSPEFKERSKALGIEPVDLRTDKLAAWIEKEITRWRGIAAAANIKVE
jgi:tripartite-type tricarboxylate transporter receptor subunit TctC